MKKERGIDTEPGQRLSYIRKKTSEQYISGKCEAPDFFVVCLQQESKKNIECEQRVVNISNM